MLRRCYLLEGLNALGTNVFFLGVFFHARVEHGFSDSANLLLAAAQGAAYVLATRPGGRFADRAGAGRSITLGAAGMCLALLLGWRLPHAAALFATIALYSAATALTWPALEAAIARAPGPADLGRRAGLYNVVWSVTGAAGFFFSGSLFALDPDAVFLVPLAAHALMLALLTASSGSLASSPRTGGALTGLSNTSSREFPEQQDRLRTVLVTAEGWREAGDPHGADRREHRGGALRQDPEALTETGALTVATRARFLLAARIANGLGYFLFGAFAALSPTVAERLGLEPRQGMWLVSAYLFARGAVFLLFWRWDGWEYRRGWVAAALALPPAALAAVFLSPAGTVVTAALALLGALSGIAYSASLHASLDREGGEGEGGGIHEWVIGIGVLAGPLAGAAGAALFGGTAGAGGLVTALGAAAAVAGLAPLRKDRVGA